MESTLIDTWWAITTTLQRVPVVSSDTVAPIKAFIFRYQEAEADGRTIHQYHRRRLLHLEAGVGRTIWTNQLSKGSQQRLSPEMQAEGAPPTPSCFRTRRGWQANQEEEWVSIKVKPGWKEGTKITFEGMGNEVPGGCHPADITFVIAEKQLNLFRREGDDLELVVDIPLVDALSGCTIPIPLLDGKKMDLSIGEIVHPG
ncbi:dnaJ homolog subfamily A member 1-like [Mangifera indica]|uniref:dnaJ homolog subfamily A member 1-like n=1 Tax=Mangifera indica TaxID=29780 RepID=UPI001CFBE379|nr:dnaJ homolog subfamily A member 1-like [Mangifera indica]